MKYTNLADAYKDPQNNIRVTHWYDISIGGWVQEPENPKFFDYIADNTYPPLSNAEILGWTNRMIWETVGRMTHLIADMGVPAHAHGSWHVTETYEKEYMPNHFQDWNSNNVIGGLLNINNKQNPLRFVMYTTNQIADRFAGNQGIWPFTAIIPGDDVYQYYNGSDNYFEVINPIYLNTTVPFEPDDIDDIYCQAIAEKAYLFSMRAIGGFLWYVYNQFEIQTEPPPPIFNPLPHQSKIICPGESGTITCNLMYGQNPANYTFTWAEKNQGSKPIGINYSTNSNILSITYNPPLENKPLSDPPAYWHFICTATNLSGTASIIVKPYIQLNCNGGCPYLIITQQDTNYFFDNNLLHKSQLPENQGNFITDKYILKTKPGIFDNKIKLDILETSIDSTLINSIKLYSVTHPLGTKLGILGDNTIVMYDSASVIQTDNASLFDLDNGYTNITDIFQFHNPPPLGSTVVGDSLYHIFAEYKNSEIINPAIINYMKRGINPVPIPAPKDNLSGNLLVNSPSGRSSFPFVRRENPDDVIIPFTAINQYGSADSIHIAWDKSFRINYSAVASLLYSGFTVSELPLVSAFHTSDGNVLQNLLYLDSGYSYVSPNSYLNLEFSNTPSMAPQFKTDYVLEINGKVIFLGSNKMRSTKVINSNQSTIPDKYSLSQNYPNPFNPVTKINFALPKQGFVTLKIYDVLGREVRTLVNEFLQPGTYSVDWNASNFPSGVYFYRLQSDNFIETKKMLMIK